MVGRLTAQFRATCRFRASAHQNYYCSIQRASRLLPALLGGRGLSNMWSSSKIRTHHNELYFLLHSTGASYPGITTIVSPFSFAHEAWWVVLQTFSNFLGVKLSRSGGAVKKATLWSSGSHHFMDRGATIQSLIEHWSMVCNTLWKGTVPPRFYVPFSGHRKALLHLQVKIVLKNRHWRCYKIFLAYWFHKVYGDTTWPSTVWMSFENTVFYMKIHEQENINHISST